MRPLVQTFISPRHILHPSFSTSRLCILSRRLPPTSPSQCLLLAIPLRPFSSDSSRPPPPSPPPPSSPSAPPSQSTRPSSSSPVPSSPPPPDLSNLPSQLELRRSDLSKRFSSAMDDVQTALFNAGQRLNDLTGYSDIETLKRNIEQQEAFVKSSRTAVASAKVAYQSAISRRSASQREVNELLQRKHAWSPADLERFTELYRSDHANEQAEIQAQQLLADAERTADEAQAGLARNILARYHEEQIWSDKIRRASTWGTWGLMGFNVLLFIVVQLGLEPWKRRRLVGGFEEKVREVMREETVKNSLLVRAAGDEERVEDLAMPVRALAAEETGETAKSALLVGTARNEEGVGGLGAAEDAIGAKVGISTADAENVEAVSVEAVADELSGPPEPPQPLVVQIRDMLKDPKLAGERIKERVKSLLSDEEVTLPQKQVTTAVLGGVATGAFLSAIFTYLLSHH